MLAYLRSNNYYTTNDFFTARTILTLYNESVTRINKHVLKRLPSKRYVLYTIDQADINIDTNIYSIIVKEIAAINPLLLPPSRLELKVGATIILIYNLNPTEGLYNSSRIIITKLTRFAI